MHASVITVVDSKRKCGWRKNGLYLRSEGEFHACGKLPFALDKPCPVRGAGVRISRGLQKICLSALMKDVECSTPDECRRCATNTVEFAWMMSVGEKFYNMPGDFAREAIEQGISKRIHAIPRGFKVGESYVALCHKKAVVKFETVEVPLDDDLRQASSDEPGLLDADEGKGVVKKVVPVFTQGIFSIFKPTRIEYVVKGDETDEQIERMIERGITPVNVVKDELLQTQLPDDAQPETSFDPDGGDE